MEASREKRIAYLKHHLRFSEDSAIMGNVFRENHKWDWLTDEQLGDVINHLTARWRRMAAMNRRNRENAKKKQNEARRARC